MKILYISHTSQFSGAENCLYTLLKNINRSKFEPVVILPEEGPLVQAIKSLDIKTTIFPLHWWIQSKNLIRDIKCCAISDRSERIASIIQNEKIDLVHTNTSVIIEGAVAAKLAGRPHVWHIHEFLDGHPHYFSDLPIYASYKIIDLLSDEVVFVSHYLKQKCPGIDPSKQRVIHNGIDIKQTGKTASIKKELGLPQDINLVLSTGTVTIEKDHSTLIDAAKLVLARNREVMFLVAGKIIDLRLYGSLRKKLKKSGIDKNFIFLGFREDIAEILSESNIFVLSSVAETFSLALLEAMSAGKPVVATRCGGPEEIVEDHKTGYLVDVKNPQSMADAILRLLENKEEIVKMGLEGQKLFNNLFTKERYVSEFENLYENIKPAKSLTNEENNLLNSLIDIYQNVCRLKFMEYQCKGLSSRLNYSIWRIMSPVRYVSHLFARYMEAVRINGFVHSNKALFKKYIKMK